MAATADAPPRRRRRRAWLIGAALVVIVLVGAGGLLVRAGFWPAHERRTITSASWPYPWPFPAASAQLVCDRTLDRTVTLSVVVDHRGYALPIRSSDDRSPEASRSFTAAFRQNLTSRDLTLIALTDDARELCEAPGG